MTDQSTWADRQRQVARNKAFELGRKEAAAEIAALKHMLIRLTEKVERACIVKMVMEDWAELSTLTGEARALLESK